MDLDIGIVHTYNNYNLQVNHAQVASGEVDQGVIDNDIDPELPEEEAHALYGARVADWLALAALQLGVLSAEQAQGAELRFSAYTQDTATFLQPFVLAHQSEQRGDTSPYVEDVQVDI